MTRVVLTSLATGAIIAMVAGGVGWDSAAGGKSKAARTTGKQEVVGTRWSRSPREDLRSIMARVK